MDKLSYIKGGDLEWLSAKEISKKMLYSHITVALEFDQTK